MNSDFMQQQGELLARRLAGEPTTTDRVQKAYRLIFGRAATEAEVRAAVQYLSTEPMKEYEERKAGAAGGAGGAGRVGGAGKEGEVTKVGGAGDASGADRVGKSDDRDADDKTTDESSDGMMAGVVPGAQKKDEAKKLLPVTVWGRYLKTLLSSNEFIFIS